MSHFVKLSGFVVKNKRLLSKAMKNLGVDYSVEENSTIRGYMGRETKVDLAVKMRGATYDLGFNYSKEDGGYVPMLESMNRYLGVPTSKTETGRCIGKLIREYNKEVVVDNARKQGFSVRCKKVGDELVVELET